MQERENEREKKREKEQEREKKREREKEWEREWEWEKEKERVMVRARERTHEVKPELRLHLFVAAQIKLQVSQLGRARLQESDAKAKISKTLMPAHRVSGANLLCLNSRQCFPGFGQDYPPRLNDRCRC